MGEAQGALDERLHRLEERLSFHSWTTLSPKPDGMGADEVVVLLRSGDFSLRHSQQARGHRAVHGGVGHVQDLEVGEVIDLGGKGEQ